LQISPFKVIRKVAPQQGSNCTECGVFATIIADFLSDDLPLEQIQLKDMPHFRYKIGAAILRGELNYKIN